MSENDLKSIITASESLSEAEIKKAERLQSKLKRKHKRQTRKILDQSNLKQETDLNELLDNIQKKKKRKKSVYIDTEVHKNASQTQTKKKKSLCANLPDIIETNTQKKDSEEIEASVVLKEQTISNWMKSEATKNEEEDDFFTKDEWSDANQEENTVKKQKQSITTSAVNTVITEQPSTLLDEGDKLIWGRANWPHHKERVDLESGLLYIPTENEVPIHVKTSGKPARYAEAEGLHVGRPPPVAPVNIRRLENRILAEARAEHRDEIDDSYKQAQPWFTEEGKLNIVASPLKPVPNRPLNSAELESSPPEEYKRFFLPPLTDEETQRIFKDRGAIERLRLTVAPGQRNPRGVGVTNEAPGLHRRLELELVGVTITQHHLFTREHIHALNLRQLVTTLESLLERDQVNACIQRIAALKRAIQQIEETKIISSRGDDCKNQEMQKTHQMRSEIEILRRARNKTEGMQRNLMVSILRSWKRVKDVREEQDCVNTTVSVKILREKMDKLADEVEWKREIAELVEEERQIFSITHEELMREYERSLEEHQKIKNDQSTTLSKKHRPLPPAEFNAAAVRKEITAELRKCRRLPGESKLTVLLSELSEITPDALCPRTELLRRKQMRAHQYFVKIFYNNKLVDQTHVQQLDDEFMLKFSRIYPLQITKHAEAISAQLYEKRGFCKRMVVEVNLPQTSCVAHSASHHIIPLSFSVSSANKKHVHETVVEALDGSGETVIQLGSFQGSILMGAVWMDCKPISPSGHNIAYSSNQLSQINQKSLDHDPETDVFSHLDPNDVNESKLLQIVNETTGADGLEVGRCDNDDRVGPQLRAIGVSYFRLNPLLPEFLFCSEEDLDASRRFRLVNLRSQRQPGFTSIQIPLNSHEIPREIFEEIDKENNTPVRSIVPGFEIHKLERDKYLKRIRGEFLKHLNFTISKKSLRDVVVEDKIPNIAKFGAWLGELVRPRRPLYPERKEQNVVCFQQVKENGLDILITVREAKNLPMRSNTQLSLAAAGATVDGENRNTEVVLRPIVEVRFMDSIQTTPVAEGCNPSWNAELCLVYKPATNIQSLDTVDESVFINVFDEVTNVSDATQSGYKRSSLSAENKFGAAATIQHTEHRWLGGLEVPFSVIYTNSKVIGSLELKLPSILLGYDYPKSHGNDSHNPCISVYITLQPSVQQHDPLENDISTSEIMTVVAQVDTWQKDAEKKSKSVGEVKEFRAFVRDASCQNILVTRYLTPLNPPTELLPTVYTRQNIEDSKLRMAQYVSLIPFVADSVAFQVGTDVWCSSEQFLKMMCGDYEEHAVLFTCFLLHLDQQWRAKKGEVVDEDFPTDRYDGLPHVLLCFGKAIPEGKTVFVLARDYVADVGEGHTGPAWRLWNPITGRSYSLLDANSPLRAVWTVASQGNIWANIQSKLEPWEISWDLTNRKSWLPTFGAGGPGLLGGGEGPDAELRVIRLGSRFTVQTNRLFYKCPDDREIQTLKFTIEEALRDALIEWRPGKITRMNYEFIRELVKTLEILEENCTRTNMKAVNFCSKILAKYNAFGFPLNLPYMEKESILKRVKATGIHQLIGVNLPSAASSISTSETLISSWISHPEAARLAHSAPQKDIQFSVAVYIKPYPGDLISIWIYLVALWPKLSLANI